MKKMGVFHISSQNVPRKRWTMEVVAIVKKTFLVTSIIIRKLFLIAVKALFSLRPETLTNERERGETELWNNSVVALEILEKYDGIADDRVVYCGFDSCNNIVSLNSSKFPKIDFEKLFAWNDFKEV